MLSDYVRFIANGYNSIPAVHTNAELPYKHEQLAHQLGKLSRSCPYTPRRPLHVALSPLFNIHLISRDIPMR